MNIYQNALDSQTACNLLAVVNRFATDLKSIREMVAANNGGTDEINQHPVCRLYAEQIAHLSGAGMCTNSGSYKEAYNLCQELAEKMKPKSPQN